MAMRAIRIKDGEWEKIQLFKYSMILLEKSFEVDNKAVLLNMFPIRFSIGDILIKSC